MHEALRAGMVGCRCVTAAEECSLFTIERLHKDTWMSDALLAVATRQSIADPTPQPTWLEDVPEDCVVDAALVQGKVALVPWMLIARIQRVKYL